MRRWILGLALSLAAAGAMAQTIVDLDFVKQAVARGALLWDARDEDAFAKGHIAGAVNVGDPTLSLRNSLTEDYLPTADLEKVLGGAGLDPSREIIVYGDRGLPSVYFAQLTLRYFGATNARVFHDGIDAWRAAGLAVTNAPTRPKAVALKLKPQPGVLIESKDVVAALKRSDVQMLDVRTVKEFKGEDIRAIRGGHIPAAINVPFEQNWVDPDTRSKLRSGAVKDSSGHGAQAAPRTGQGLRKARPREGDHRLLPERQSRGAERRGAGRPGLQERQGLRLILARLIRAGSARPQRTRSGPTSDRCRRRSRDSRTASANWSDRLRPSRGSNEGRRALPGRGQFCGARPANSASMRRTSTMKASAAGDSIRSRR